MENIIFLLSYFETYSICNINFYLNNFFAYDFCWQHNENNFIQTIY